MKTAVKLLLVTLLFTFVFLPLVALAQDAGVPDIVVPPLDTATFGDMLALFSVASQVGGPAAMAVAAVLLVTLLLRQFGSKLPAPVGVWLGSPLAGWILPLVFSIGAMLFTALANGRPINLGTILASIVAGLAAGGFLSRPLGAAKVAAAEAAGAAAASAPASKTDKLDAVTK